LIPGVPSITAVIFIPGLALAGKDCTLCRMTDSDRITRLEERFTHLQQHVTEQDRVVLGLSEMVDRLRKELTALRTQVETNAAETPKPSDEKPPHY
jgi:uncharacterized coiled-coil protein SlyX